MAAFVFEPSARILRALAMADLLDAAGISSADVASLHPAEWRMAVEAAQSNRVPSEQTRALVVDLLRRPEAARAIVAAEGRTKRIQ